MKREKPAVGDAPSFGESLLSPRHPFWFRVTEEAQKKIVDRFERLLEADSIEDKRPIINIQEDQGIVEIHDGNASAVAWLLYARARDIEATLENFERSFPNTVVLRNRMHPENGIWHPYVPPEVGCADELQDAWDDEQRRRVKKAVTKENEAVYFNDAAFFAGEDATETVEAVALELLRAASEGTSSTRQERDWTYVRAHPPSTTSP